MHGIAALAIMFPAAPGNQRIKKPAASGHGAAGKGDRHRQGPPDAYENVTA